MMWWALVGAIVAAGLVQRPAQAQQETEVALSRQHGDLRIFGVIVEKLMFGTIERHTVQKGGTQT